MTTSPMAGSRTFYRHASIAAGIALGLTLALALLCHPIVATYFPYAEEWKILLPSLPQFAQPRDWFRGFAAVMNDPYPAWSVAAINFFRPVMNAVYWLRGVMFGDNWGAALYFNFAFIGLAAGTLYLCLRTLRYEPNSTLDEGTTGLWGALLLVGTFILMPPMVSGASGFLPLILPQMPFGRLLAALCLLACLSYAHERYLLAALLLAAALLTKEQALPMAIALPLTYAWSNRHTLRNSIAPLLLLAAPLLVWVGLRIFLFGSVSQGVYVLLDGPAAVVFRFILELLKLPLYPPHLSAALHNPLSVQAILVLCNLTVLAYVALDIFKRWRAFGPDVISVAAIGYWGFLAMVGLNTRYGTLIIALTVLILARRAAPGVPVALRTTALVAFTLAGTAHGVLSYRSYPVHTGFSQTIYQVGRDYATALARVNPEVEVIVVLNDPNTPYTAPSDMAQVLALPVSNVFKASDYPWRWPTANASSIPDQSCTVSVTRLSPGTVALQQSCGLQIMGALVPNEKEPTLPLTDGVEVRFPQTKFNTDGLATSLGTQLLLRVQRANVAVLYFDPEIGQFSWLDPGQTEENTND